MRKQQKKFFNRCDIRHDHSTGRYNTRIFLVSLLLILSINIFPQQHNKLVKITFSEQMDTTSIKEKSNYTIFDSQFRELTIYRIGLEQGEVDSVAYLEIPFPTYKTNYIVRVENARDRAGNLIDPEHNAVWFFFDGFDIEGEIELPEAYLHRRK